jgi:gas vesicle protein
MTILDRAGGARRIRIDASAFADELAKHLPDLDRARDAATTAIHDAAGSARDGMDRAAEIARVVRGDIARTGERIGGDNPIDELGKRIRAVASTAGVRDLVGRLERDLPEVDRDTYHRAYTRGRAQARSKYLVLGVVAGLGTGVVAAVLLDPKHGKERRDTIARRTSSLTRSVGKAVSGRARYASDRARGLAIERGAIKAPGAEPVAETSSSVPPGGMAPPAMAPAELETAPDALDVAPDSPAIPGPQG